MVKCGPDGVAMAARAISSGGTVIFPTDTVYGIGCDPFDADAVGKIYDIKKRSSDMPLPVLARSREAAGEIAYFDAHSEKVADSLWPGRVTMILALKDERLKGSLGIGDKIAVRVPDHDCVQLLLDRCKYVVGTSANVSGTRPATDPSGCKDIPGYDLLLDGGTIPGPAESTIIEFEGGRLKVHREGAIRVEEVMRVL